MSRDQSGSSGKNKTVRSTTEPPTKNEYPDSRVIANEAFEIRYGTQDGKQFYQFFGPGGTMHTIYADGTHDVKNVGELKQYNKAGVTITVDENNDVHIRGHSKLQVGGGAHIEVAGDAGVIVGGTAAVSAKDLGIQAKNIYMGATGNFNLNVEGDSTIDTKGNLKILVGQNTTVDTKQTTQFDSGENHNTNAKNIVSDAKEAIAKIAPQMNVNVPATDWTGNITETGIHIDSNGLHS